MLPLEHHHSSHPRQLREARLRLDRRAAALHNATEGSEQRRLSDSSTDTLPNNAVLPLSGDLVGSG